MDRTRGFLHAEVEARDWEEQRSLQAARLREVLALGEAQAPAVAALLRGAGARAGDFHSLEDLGRLPVTPKARLVELQREHPPFGGFLAVPLAQVRRIFRSPGPILDPQTPGEGWGWEEGLFAAGFRPGDVCVNTFGYQMTPAGMMFDEALGALGCPLVPTGVGDRDTQIEILRSLGVTGYTGMASFLLQIGERAREQGLDPARDFHLKAAFTTAEPLPDSLRNSVEEMFGATVRQGFGTAECGCLAYECHERGGMHLASRAIVEIADPESGRPLGPGEIGEIVVTLLSPAFPLLRLGTGDLSAVDPVACACGRPAPKLRGWLGRCDQLVKVKGMFLHPGAVQAAMRAFPEVARFRAVVTREEGRDVLTVQAEAQAPDEGLRVRIETRLREALGIGAGCRWVPGDSLPADGKVIDDLRKWD
ncbi:MAG: AMP-binding protein [Acidobacteria bacterium]|nr:AMP-binding protein [Acidobacteriota bacterium]